MIRFGDAKKITLNSVRAVMAVSAVALVLGAVRPGSLHGSIAKQKSAASTNAAKVKGDFLISTTLNQAPDNECEAVLYGLSNLVPYDTIHYYIQDVHGTRHLYSPSATQLYTLNDINVHNTNISYTLSVQVKNGATLKGYSEVSVDVSSEHGACLTDSNLHSFWQNTFYN